MYNLRASLFFIAVLCIIIVSCRDGDQEEESELERSKQKWAELELDNGNSYELIIKDLNVSRANQTRLIIENGEVVLREYSEARMNVNLPPDQWPLEVVYKENIYADNLGAYTKGAQVLNMEEWHYLCELYSHDKASWETVLSFDENGILQSCRKYEYIQISYNKSNEVLREGFQILSYEFFDL